MTTRDRISPLCRAIQDGTTGDYHRRRSHAQRRYGSNTELVCGGCGKLHGSMGGLVSHYIRKHNGIGDVNK